MISVEEYLDVCDAALDGYAQVCRALGDDLVSVRLEDVPGLLADPPQDYLKAAVIP